jgi:DNA polymerase I-like protein with 3'-5' exonuclease and polymerase domains
VARIIRTAEITNLNTLPVFDREAVYNGLDCCITAEVRDKLLPQVLASSEASIIYDFERALQAPILEMDLRGILIDEGRRQEMILKMEREKVRTQEILNRFANAVWGSDLNPNSPKQLKTFFYTCMNIPPIYKYAGGKRTITTDRDALEKLDAYIYARPIVRCILALRGFTKKISVLKSGVSPDGRLRSSYNIGGTETGRLSSSESAFKGEGTNQQNITPELRIIQISDPDKKLCYIDLEQAESRDVAYISEDEAYIAACEGGDLHTTVTKMVWKELRWWEQLTYDEQQNLYKTGEGEGISVTKVPLLYDRGVADAKFYRWFSYRDMGKRGGHGTNYYGTPQTMAKHLKVPAHLMEAFRRAYFAAFPGIPAWHRSCAQQLQLTGINITPFGRKRQFFGRRFDDTTLREYIAHEPQSMCADYINLGMWRVWKHMPEVELLSQVHDAIAFQYEEHLENEIIPKVMEYLDIHLKVKGRILRIPSEPQVGWNLGKFHKEKNPDGLKKWIDNDTRTRQREPSTSILDVCLS